MKRIIYLFISVILLYGCSSETTISEGMKGHWMQKDFYEAVKNKKNIAEITAPKMEFIIPNDDSNFYFIVYGQKPYSDKLIPYKKDHVVIRNFFGNNNADVLLKDNELLLINAYTKEETRFIKITEDIYKPETARDNESYSIPYIHHQYISGTYKTDSGEVKFVDQGKIKGLGKYENFSFCYEPSCRYSNKNTLFLSDENYEGNYFEYEINNDSLIIYEIDYNAIARGMKSKSVGVKFALKKIN